MLTLHAYFMPLPKFKHAKTTVLDGLKAMVANAAS